jgi:hypothetical protein
VAYNYGLHSLLGQPGSWQEIQYYQRKIEPTSENPT